MLWERSRRLKVPGFNLLRKKVQYARKKAEPEEVVARREKLKIPEMFKVNRVTTIRF